jgi:predicted Zn-dependent protease
MTRDGTFRIRDGRLAEPLVNLRFTTSFPALARHVAAIGADRRLVAIDHFYEQRYPNAPLVPGLATTSFQVVGNGSVPGL